MTHFEREREAQELSSVLPSLSTLDLRQLRAWLADVLLNGTDLHRDIAEVRGQIIHAEIFRRECSGKDDPKVAPVLHTGLLKSIFSAPQKVYRRDWAWNFCTRLPQ